MVRCIYGLCAIAWVAGAQPVRWREHAIELPAETAGGAWNQRGGELYLWGEGLHSVRLPSGRQRTLLKGKFRAGGCLAGPDLVLQAATGEIGWIAGPRFGAFSPIDSDADMADCLEATLLKERGVLVTHRGMQVRHYRRPERPGGPWPYREIYSFYTASYQAGLQIADVDGDGRPDLLCGNYWIQSPTEYELPWRLFAINTYNEEPESARMRLALLPGGRHLVVAQGALARGRLTVFEKPPDPAQLWIERRLREDLDHPLALGAADFDGDGVPDFAVGGGDGLTWWRQSRAGKFEPTSIRTGFPVRQLWVADVNRDRRPDIIVLGERTLLWLENQPIQ